MRCSKMYSASGNRQQNRLETFRIYKQLIKLKLLKYFKVFFSYQTYFYSLWNILYCYKSQNGNESNFLSV